MSKTDYEIICMALAAYARLLDEHDMPSTAKIVNDILKRFRAEYRPS